MRYSSLSRSFAFFALLGLLVPSLAVAKTGDSSTWLSKVYDGDGGDGNSAYLDSPTAFAADAQCNLYIADTNNYGVRRLDATTNVITTVVGNAQYGSRVVNSNPLASQMKAPAGVVQGPNGNWYISDRDEGTVRELRADGTFNRTAIKNMKQPNGLASDGTYLYIAETGRNQVLKLPWVTVMADAGAISIGSNSIYLNANVPAPWHVAVDGSSLFVTMSKFGELRQYFIDHSAAYTSIATNMDGIEGLTVYNHDVYFTTHATGVKNQLRKYDPDTGTTTTLQDVQETQWYNHNSDLLFCGGKMYILMLGGSSVFRADLDGGNPVKIAGAFRWNTRTGPRSIALVGRPKAFARYGSKLYIMQNHRFDVLDLHTFELSFMAGRSADAYTDGVGDVARVSGPTQMVISPNGKYLYFGDRNNNRIRYLNTTTNEIKTLTGAGKDNLFNGDTNGYREGTACPGQMSTGVAGCAYFTRPTGIAISPNGKTIYVADSLNNRIRTVDVATGKTTLLAGSTKGYKNGVGSAARFNLPNNLLLSKDGRTLYVVDVQNNVIRAIDVRTKRVSTLAGVGKGGYLDGAFNKAYFSVPDSLAWGGNTRTIYLSEVGSQRIRKLDLVTKRVTTLSGTAARGTNNGAAGKTSFNNPRGMIMIAAHTLLVADSNNDLIRAVKTQ